MLETNLFNLLPFLTLIQLNIAMCGIYSTTHRNTQISRKSSLKIGKESVETYEDEPLLHVPHWNSKKTMAHVG